MEVKVLKAEDWEGLFIDDKLVYEAHRLSAEDILLYMDKGINMSYKHVHQD